MDLRFVLEQFKAGELELEEVVTHMSGNGMDDMGFVKIDTARERRTGIPEVIYSEEKR